MKKTISFVFILFVITNVIHAQTPSPYIELCGKYQFNEDIYLPVYKAIRLGSTDEYTGSRIKFSVDPTHGGVFDYFPKLAIRAGKASGDGFTYVMTLKENGNVGVGIDPTEKLDVNGTVKGTKLRSQNSTGYAEMNAVAGYFNFSTDRPYFYFNKPVRVTGGNIGSNSGNLNLQTAGSTKMTILSANGNVGIGTSAPTYKLHMNGDAKVNNNLRVAGHQYIPNSRSLIFGHETDKKKQLSLRFVEGTPTGDSYLQYGGNLYIYSGAVSNYVGRIGEDGNFYIGWKEEIETKRNLTVSGTVKASKLETKVDVWSDFVFSDNYDLPSIGEVKSHIKEHKHLPGIPSEKEVLENGIDVADMQAKLLQKIEELTLYTIQQQEIIDNHQETISEQKNIILEQQKMFDSIHQEISQLKDQLK
ncbi:MAG: hypothetical protein LIO93_02210 [Bacteroidales bacterium]|nr:hypothetical protein [Bacteroidales bacterium]